MLMTPGRYIQEKINEITGVVLEIRLAAGELFKDIPEVEDGNKTGIFFAAKIRELRPDMPIAFLTAYGSLAVEQMRHSEPAKVQPEYLFYSKRDYLPDQLVLMIATEWDMPFMAL